MREFRLQEPRLGPAVNSGRRSFALMVYADSRPEMHEVIAVVDPMGWRIEAKVANMVTPADFEHVGQVELTLEPTGAASKGRLVECDNSEHPTGWKWVP